MPKRPSHRRQHLMDEAWPRGLWVWTIPDIGQTPWHLQELANSIDNYA